MYQIIPRNLVQHLEEWKAARNSIKALSGSVCPDDLLDKHHRYFSFAVDIMYMHDRGTVHALLMYNTNRVIYGENPV